MSTHLPTHQIRRRAWGAIIAVALVAPTTIAVAPAAEAAAIVPGTAVVINEVYGGGGNSGGAFNQDFIELWNPTDAAISLDGWSVQYASTTGAWNNQTNLSGTIGAHQSFLVGEALGADATQPALPAHTVDGTIAMSGTGGKVALVTTTTRLACATPADCAADATVSDLVGWGAATTFLGTGPAPATTNATAVSRDANHTNTGNNAVDFTVGAPTPASAGGGGTDPEEPPTPTTATIAEIQGSGAASLMVGQTVTTTGVVTAAYPTGGFNGYVIQTGGTGGAIDLATHTASDAIYVFSSTTVGLVQIGQTVQVTGRVAEFQGLTELEVTGAANLTVLDATAVVTPATFDWPASEAQREAVESMLYAPGQFTVTNSYSANQYSEVGLAAGDTPLIQWTDAARPNSAEAAAIIADNAARAVTLDDGSSTNFLSSANTSLTPPYLSMTDPVRVGAAVTFTEPVVIDYRNNLWKFQPTSQLTYDEQQIAPFVRFELTRTSAPQDVGGDFRLATFNVLNYFTTGGDQWPGCSSYNDRQSNPITVNTCGEIGPRGAWDAANLQRQQDKIVAAITALDADIVGLMEIENSIRLGKPADSALATLVAALNEAAGAEVWAYVPSSAELPAPELMDVITTALIYRPAVVTPVGQSRALGTLSGAGQAFENAREPIGQVFEPVGGGQTLLVAVNHFKSKGSGSGVGDADAGDGQGPSNGSRVRQATALRDWVTEITAPGDAVALIGDFNSYTMEDPMQVFYDAGYVDAASTLNQQQWSYSFSGLSGSLDHILLNGPALERATGSDIWEINAEESVALQYSRYNYHGTLFYAPDVYASSDHNPEIVGFTRGVVAASQWDHQTQYAAGDRVTHRGVTWQATQDVKGQEPGKGPHWVQVDVVGYPLWTQTGKYSTGDIVTHGGQLWQASRDINGQEPGKGKFWTWLSAA